MVLADSEPSDVVAFFGIFFVFGFPVIAWLTMRYLAHRERMEMIRHGFEPGKNGRAYRDWQRAQPAAAPSPVPPAPPYGYPYPNEAAQIALRKAIVIVAVGFALTIGLSLRRLGSGELPGAEILGGLIPLFVGLAQVFSALTAGATFRPIPPGAQYFYGPPAAPTPPGAAPPPPGAPQPEPFGSYTYRPGSTPELRPPSPPVQRDN